MITLYTFGPKFGLPDPSPFVTKTLVQIKLSGLPFEVDTRGFRKAPKGKLPYIKDGDRIIADSTMIERHLAAAHGIDLDKGLDAEQRAIGWAFAKMCEEHLYWAIVHFRWRVKENFDIGPRHFFDEAPALVRPLVIAMIRRSVKRTLHGQGFGRHTNDEIAALAARDLDAIAAFLGSKDFLFGSEPHSADATVFASVISALCPLFATPARAHALSHANLVAYAERGMRRWFPEIAWG